MNPLTNDERDWWRFACTRSDLSGDRATRLLDDCDEWERRDEVSQKEIDRLNKILREKFNERIVAKYKKEPNLTDNELAATLIGWKPDGQDVSIPGRIYGAKWLVNAPDMSKPENWWRALDVVCNGIRAYFRCEKDCYTLTIRETDIFWRDYAGATPVEMLANYVRAQKMLQQTHRRGGCGGVTTMGIVPITNHEVSNEIKIVGTFKLHTAHVANRDEIRAGYRYPVKALRLTFQGPDCAIVQCDVPLQGFAWLGSTTEYEVILRKKA